MTERVQKNWQTQGLGEYSLPAILGTLNHYGVACDEAGFKKLATERFPLQIASEWLSDWKGTGQFARFPVAAAQELWKRLEGERMTPTEYANELALVMKVLHQKAQGAGDASAVRAAFEKVEALKPRVPLQNGHPQESFVEEIFSHFDEKGMQLFDELPERLAKAGQREDAQTFSDLESYLLPERAGLSRVLIKAATGEKDAALVDLRAMTADTTRSMPARMMAIDGLIHLEAYEDAKAPTRALLDEAEKAEDHHLAMALIARLGHLLESTDDMSDVEALAERQERIQEAHAKAHPHHV